MKYMKLIEPWKTAIGMINIKDKVDLAALADEIIQLHCLTHDDDTKPFKTDDSITPLCMKLIDDHITPAVKIFCKEAMGFDLTDFRIDTFGKWFKAGQNLTAHLHGGTGITTIFYCADSKDSLISFDPRGNACRGYPRDVRDNHFGNLVIAPKAGDIYIVPSYIQHCIPTVEDEMRLSLVNDYLFKGE